MGIWVARVLRNLDHYADLIRHDVIVIVPRPDWIDTREIVDLDRAIGNDLREAFPEQQVDHWGVSHAAQAAAALVTQMRTAERYPALDPYFPTQGYWRVSERLHALARDDTCGTSTQAALLTEFLRLEIAQPRELSMRDIVRIRHDGQFDRFRASIATGIVRYLTLAQAAGGAPLLAQPAADLKREIATSVREEATLAERDLGWLKRPETTTTVELLLIAGAAASAFTEPATAAGLASSAAIPVVAEAFLRWRRANSALARHVSVFR